MIELIRNKNIKDEDLPFFARESYLKTISNDFGWFINEDFLLPFVVRKRFVFRFITFTCETVSLRNVYTDEKEKSFLNEVINNLRKLKFDFITQPPTNVLFKAFPDKSEYCNFGTYVIDLKNDEETLFQNIHSKHKNVIRKAIKDSIVSERGQHLKDICYNIINDTLVRQGIVFMGKSEYDNFIAINNENIEIFTVKNKDVYEGAALIFWDKDSAYYQYGGSTANHHLGAMNLLQWEAIKYFKSLGIKEYNLVGARIHPDNHSKVHGIQEFKRRFGGELRQGYLWKYDINPFKKKVFNTLIYLKTRRKPLDIIDNERKKDYSSDI